MKKLTEMTAVELHAITGCNVDSGDYVGSVYPNHGFTEFVLYKATGELSEAIEVDDTELFENGYGYEGY